MESFRFQNITTPMNGNGFCTKFNKIYAICRYCDMIRDIDECFEPFDGDIDNVGH